MRGVLLFAAASENKLNGLLSFPGNQQDVISICAADGDGRALSPRLVMANRRPTFAVLGEQIPVRSDRPGEEEWVSGSSFATATATGIAANIVDIARRGTHHPLRKDEIDHLHRAEGMASVLKTMSQEIDGTLLLSPRKLFDPEKSPRGVAETIRSALAPTLSTRRVDEADMSELASDAGSSTYSAYSGTTLGGYQLTSSEESITRLLFDDPVLNPLYRPGLTRLGYLVFQRHFTRILRRHAGRLLEEAKADLEKKYASLVSYRPIQEMLAEADVVLHTQVEV